MKALNSTGGDAMMNHSLFFCFFLLMAGGCATITETGRANRFETTSSTFERAIKISDFDTALDHIKPGGTGEDRDPALYRDVKIVDYRLKQRHVSDAGLNVRETIRIDYYRVDSAILRQLQHEQIWTYDEANGAWLLGTELPFFP